MVCKYIEQSATPEIVIEINNGIFKINTIKLFTDKINILLSCIMSSLTFKKPTMVAYDIGANVQNRTAI